VVNDMSYPLIHRELLSNLRLVHAFYNTGVTALFFYQGWTGFLIRRARKGDRPLPFPMIRRHRKTGPIAAILGVFGFFLGLTLVLLDTGRILEYPAHLATGFILIMLISTAYAVSRRIKGPDSPFRTRHSALGAAVLLFYLIEAFLGFGVLF
jgi:hypothetical protein